jgi:hypothetical protein
MMMRNSTESFTMRRYLKILRFYRMELRQKLDKKELTFREDKKLESDLLELFILRRIYIY